MLVRELPGISRPLTLALAICVVVSAGLPTAFVITTGSFVGALQGVVQEGLASADRQHLLVLLTVLGGTFVAQQTIGPLQWTISDALGRRLMGATTHRIMRATTRPASVAHLEDPAYLDQITRAFDARHWAGPRTALNGFVAETTMRLQALAALVLVAHFRWWLAALLLVALVNKDQRFRQTLHQIIVVRMGKAADLRRANYFRNLALQPGAAKEIRIFGLADWVVERFQAAWIEAMESLWKGRPRLLATSALAALPLVIVEVLGLGIVAYDALAGTIGVGALLVYGRSILATEGLAAVSDNSSRVDFGAAGLVPARELEQTSASEPRLNPPGTLPADGLPQREIRFEGVAFSYPGRAGTVFFGLDLTVRAGRSLAIVGDNGAGKTTLVKLLARLHEPTAGRITVDGVDLTAYEPRSWQRRIAAVFQDFVRYPLSANDNVGFGAIERLGDGESMAEAAERAGALPLIERQPAGWQTILSRQFSGGVELSGGEWQRIALARALFAASAGAGVLILDEPTAHLDVRAEAAFYDRFFELTRGLTTLVISHRFSTVRRADRIVVLDRGQVAGEGTHDELLAAGGRYATMFGLQAARFVAAGGTTDLDGPETAPVV
jgi:ATP-binding cassette subfamily B protein